MAPLNPHAAEFFPHHHLQTMPLLPRYPTSIVSSSQHVLYYPHQLIRTYQVSPPSPYESEPVPFQQQQEQQQQQQKEVELDGDDEAFMRRMEHHHSGHRFRQQQQQQRTWRIKGRRQQDQNRRKMLRSAKIVEVPQSINHHQNHFMTSFSNKKRCLLTPLRPDSDKTTVMIKNIPIKYTREMLVKFLDDHCLRENEKGEGNALAFDFVYLPIDFRRGMNKGYAFVNFTNSEASWKFCITASNMKWELFQSHKICEVVAARLQGKQVLEDYFGNMCFPCQSEEVLPLFFSPPRDGVLKGEQWTVGRLAKKKP